MDWMGSAYPEALQEEWGEILRVCDQNSQILFRSGAHQPKFIDQIQPLKDDRSLGGSPKL